MSKGSILPHFVLNIKGARLLCLLEIKECKVPFNGDQVLVIGTSEGRVLIYDLLSFKLLHTAYEDPEKRRIVSIFPSCGAILIRVRTLGTLHLHYTGDQWIKQFVSFDESPTFCGSIATPTDFLCPCQGKEIHSIDYIAFKGDEISGEKKQVVLGKHTPFSMAPYGDNDNKVIIGDEAGQLIILDSIDIHAQVTLNKDPIFAISTSNEFIAAGSVNCPIFILKKAECNAKPKEIVYPQESSGVSALSFSPSGRTLLAGFWDGSIRAYSMKKRSIILHIDYHSHTIGSLVWLTNKSFIAVCEQESKISFWTVQ